MKQPTAPVPPPEFNPDAFRIDHCDKCGRPDAVPRRARRRHCLSCRLYDASARATARAKVLADAADRAFLQRRLLVMRIEDDRQAATNAKLAARDAGACGAIEFSGMRCGRWTTVWLHCVEPVNPPARCETTSPDFKLRHHYRARTASWHRLDAVWPLRMVDGACDWSNLRGAFASRYIGGGARCE